MSFQTLWEWFAENLLIHWPFVCGALVLMLVGQFVKAQIWTKEGARTSRFIRFMRRTMAMHPPLVGALLSFIPSMPVSPGVEGMGARLLYWVSVGIAAAFGFNVVRQWIKKKYDLDIGTAVAIAVNPSMSPMHRDIAEEVAQAALAKGEVAIVVSVPAPPAVPKELRHLTIADSVADLPEDSAARNEDEHESDLDL